MKRNLPTNSLPSVSTDGNQETITFLNGLIQAISINLKDKLLEITIVTLTLKTLYLFKKYTNFEVRLSNCTLYTKQVKNQQKIK